MAYHKTTSLDGPTLQELQSISDQHGLGLTSDKLAEYKDLIDGFIAEDYARLDELADVPLEVKYPRTPGYQPSPEENTHNAWYYKTNIKGVESGKLAGKKIALKDNILLAGVPMTCGSRFMEGFVPDEDATVVTKILDAGGCIVGKTNCEDMCVSGDSVTCVKGPVMNPVDKTRTSGGSSGGSACVVKLGEADMAVGADQGGSIRIPSSHCGVVGLKPTHGLVPYTGVMPLIPCVDHLGPITKNVKDAALLLEVLAGYDQGRDLRQPRDLAVPNYSELLDGCLTGKKIGVLKEGMDLCEPDIVQVIREALETFTAGGATVQDVSIPQHKDGQVIWTPTAFEGIYKTLFENHSALVENVGHQNVAAIDHFRSGYLLKSRSITPCLTVLILAGKYITDRCGLKYVAKAHNLLPRLIEAYDEMLSTFDVLVMPTLPYKAPKLLPKDCSIKDYIHQCFSMIGNTCPFDATGHPALTLNAGYSEGMPVGLQIVGRRWDEQTVLNIAHGFEENNIHSYKETGDWMEQKTN